MARRNGPAILKQPVSGRLVSLGYGVLVGLPTAYGCISVIGISQTTGPSMFGSAIRVRPDAVPPAGYVAGWPMADIIKKLAGITNDIPT
jgi:hypothetical protein